MTTTTADNPVDHYMHQVRAQLTQSPTQGIDFMLATAFILEDYSLEVARPSVMIQSKVRHNLHARTPDTSRRLRLAQQYYNAASDFTGKPVMMVAPSVVKKSTIALATSSSSIRPTATQPSCCDNFDPVTLVEYSVCATCGTVVPDSTQFSANYADVGASAQRTVGSSSNERSENEFSDKKALFIKALQKIQGLSSGLLTDEHWARCFARITEHCEQHSLTLQNLTVEDVVRLLAPSEKQNATLIWEACTGGKIVPVADGALWMILHVMAPCLSELHHTCPEFRQQRIAGGALLHKCLQTCGDESFALSTLEKDGQYKVKLDRAWEICCSYFGWNFLPLPAE